METKSKDNLERQRQKVANGMIAFWIAYALLWIVAGVYIFS